MFIKSTTEDSYKAGVVFHREKSVLILIADKLKERSEGFDNDNVTSKNTEVLLHLCSPLLG